MLTTEIPVEALRRHLDREPSFRIAMLLELIERARGKPCAVCGGPSPTVTAASLPPSECERIGVAHDGTRGPTVVLPICRGCSELCDRLPGFEAAVVRRVGDAIAAGTAESYGVIRTGRQR